MSQFWNRDPTPMIRPQLVTVVHTGKRGRPRKMISKSFLQEVMASGGRMPLTKIAKLTGTHRNHVRAALKEYGINYAYSDISDDELDALITEFRKTRPSSGIRYTMAHLRKNGYRLQRARVIASLGRVDPIGQVLRHRTATRRRQYRVPRPNALWHLDGHHKLIRWGIVIHGIIDGYCHTVLWLFFSAFVYTNL